jgi:hypothetical protein
MYLGSMLQKSTTGAAIAASFELENMVESKKAKVISDMQYKK